MTDVIQRRLERRAETAAYQHRCIEPQLLRKLLLTGVQRDGLAATRRRVRQMLASMVDQDGVLKPDEEEW